MRLSLGLLAAFAFALGTGPLGIAVHAQVQTPAITNPDRVKPYPPLRIIGNLYYVGTYDLAVYLVTTPAGHMLINTGYGESTGKIRANVEALGFKFADIKLLLATHGHGDHVGAMAEIKKMTGARMLMHEGDADLLETGAVPDYRFSQGRPAPIYEPVKVDQRLKEGDKVRLGDTELTVIHHPGHTKGSTSFTYTVREGGRDYNVLIVNMASINPGVQVMFMQAFPEITKAYTTTIQRQKQLKPDVWVSSHAGHFNLHQKYKPGDAYDPMRFVDPDGYQAKIQFYEKLFNGQLKKEREAKAD
jgi:metallo-beta-lactamase class B